MDTTCLDAIQGVVSSSATDNSEVCHLPTALLLQCSPSTIRDTYTFHSVELSVVMAATSRLWPLLLMVPVILAKVLVPQQSPANIVSEPDPRLRGSGSETTANNAGPMATRFHMDLATPSVFQVFV